MTTITIKENIQLDKTEFISLQDFVNYLLKNEPIGLLLPFDKGEITKQMEKRFKKALNTPKSDMINI